MVSQQIVVQEWLVEKRCNLFISFLILLPNDRERIVGLGSSKRAMMSPID